MSPDRTLRNGTIDVKIQLSKKCSSWMSWLPTT